MIHVQLPVMSAVPQGYRRVNYVRWVGYGAGFSDVGVTVVRRALADVREAPRHEIA